MLQRLKDWWNRDKIREERITAELKRYSDALLVERQQKAVIEQELSEANDQLGMQRRKDAADKAKREGTEPWVEIKSADYSEVKGIQIELDWNEAFIQYLKESGLKGKDEEIIVQKWLAFLYQDLIDKIEEKVVNRYDKPTVNDFE